MSDVLVRALGWKALILHGDPLVYDRWKWLKQHLRPGPLRTLDAGCGNGCFTIYAAYRGNDATGISFDKTQNDAAESRARILGIKNAHFRSLDLRELSKFKQDLGTFDQIICTEVIEHLLDDGGLVRNLADMLKPGGRLLLTTPFKDHRGLIKEKLSESEDGGHVRWGYTHDEIKRLFEQNGLRVESEEYTSGFWSQSLTNVMRASSVISEKIGWAFILPLRLLGFLDSPLTKVTRTPYFGIGLVATKAP